MQLRRTHARRRLGQAVGATIPLTEAIVLTALVAFPDTPTGTLLPSAGAVALLAGAALVAGALVGDVRRAPTLGTALVRAGALGLVAAAAVSWLPILAALTLVAL